MPCPGWTSCFVRKIHVLLGETGAGKSTLINILGGTGRSDAGTVEVDGRRVEIRHVADADRWESG